jgi:outer membrane protein
MTAGAQETPVRQWTLRECIDYAIENNVEIRQTALQVENAEIELNTARNSRLPSLSAGAGQSFGFGRFADETGATTVYHNTQSASTSLSLSADVPVFQGFRINNQIAASRLDLAAAAEGLERAKQSLELNVAAYYLDVLFKKELLGVHREQTILSRRQVENTRAKVNAKSAALSQLYDMEAQLGTNEVAEVNAENDLAIALLNLEQLLNVEDGDRDFDISDPGLDIVPAVGTLRDPEAIYEASVSMRPAVREAELLLRSSEYRVRIARAAWWPSIRFGANFNDSYSYVFNSPANKSFSEQMRNLHREGIGIDVGIPIFNRNATRNSVRQARLAVLDRELVLEGVKLALFKEIQQAWQGAVSAGARYDATTKALVSAEEAARTMELRYEEGKATVLEYSDAYTRLISSRSEQTQAKYDYLFRTKILDFYTGRPIDL